MTLVEEIRNQLSKVFTPNGDVKVCGRDECRKAIQIASEICPGVDFGNPETGIMNLQTFHDCFFCDKELKKQLFKVFDTQGTLLPINHADCRKLILSGLLLWKGRDWLCQPWRISQSVLCIQRLKSYYFCQIFYVFGSYPLCVDT